MAKKFKPGQNFNVLLTGETGTGKGFAHSIHAASARAEQPLLL